MSGINLVEVFWYVLNVLYVPACLGLIVIVLLQKGKGTGFAGAFGAGAGPGAETVFGPRAGQTLPVKLTYIAAAVFIVISMSMSLIAGRVGRGRAPDVIEGADPSASSAVSTGLEEFGLGQNEAGAGSALPPPAPAATTPAQTPAATATPAPEATPVETAPADEAPAETPQP